MLLSTENCLCVKSEMAAILVSTTYKTECTFSKDSTISRSKVSLSALESIHYSQKNDFMLECSCLECYVAKAKQTEIKSHNQVQGM